MILKWSGSPARSKAAGPPPPFSRSSIAGRPRAVALVTLTAALAISLSSARALSPAKPPDHPRWAVIVVSDNGNRYIDEPICQPVQYFSGDAQRFDYDHELAGKSSAEIKEKVDSQLLGTAQGFAVWQTTHVINGNQLTIKMILVERKAGEFCEIYHQQLAPDMVSVAPAYLVPVGAETILASTDPWIGNSGQRMDVYWTFDKDGPILLDVDHQIDEILKKLLPKGRIIMNGGGFNVQTLTYGMPVWKPRDPHCCPTGGSIEIKFALKDHQLVEVSQSYKENP
jgi:hypothetical protein